MEEKKNKYDLEQRLIDFAILIIRMAETMNKSFVAQYVKKQMLRSGISPSLHYGEVKAAESADDFIHKVKVILKELRETFNALKITKQASFSSNFKLLDEGIAECASHCVFAQRDMRKLCRHRRKTMEFRAQT